jgi:hypothetical protein
VLSPTETSIIFVGDNTCVLGRKILFSECLPVIPNVPGTFGIKIKPFCEGNSQSHYCEDYLKKLLTDAYRH